jgi:hypothetical protein
MYVKSVQQFRESLAKMKIDAHRPPEGEAENEVKPQQKQHGEARVFVLWKQSFLLNKKKEIRMIDLLLQPNQPQRSTVLLANNW